MKLLTTTEAAEMLRLSPSSVRTLCDQRKLLAIRHSPNGRRFISEESIHDYLSRLLEPQRETFTPVEVAYDPTAEELKARIKRLKRVK